MLSSRLREMTMTMIMMVIITVMSRNTIREPIRSVKQNQYRVIMSMHHYQHHTRTITIISINSIINVKLSTMTSVSTMMRHRSDHRKLIIRHHCNHHYRKQRTIQQQRRNSDRCARSQYGAQYHHERSDARNKAAPITIYSIEAYIHSCFIIIASCTVPSNHTTFTLTLCQSRLIYGDTRAMR